MLAGYPWYGQIGRQTLVALPGIALEQGRTEDCLDVLDTVVRGRRDGMFTGSFSAAEAADAPLWFFWVLQQLQRTLGEEEIWKRYGIVMKELLAAYRRGVGGVAVHDNGLVWASAPDKALTWMNALAGGVPVVSRDGYPVEINALWYNAVCYALSWLPVSARRSSSASGKRGPSGFGTLSGRCSGATTTGIWPIS